MSEHLPHGLNDQILSLLAMSRQLREQAEACVRKSVETLALAEALLSGAEMQLLKQAMEVSNDNPTMSP